MLHGTDKRRLRTLRAEVAGMLQQDGAASAAFADYAVLKRAAIYRNRHACVLLPIEALS